MPSITDLVLAAPTYPISASAYDTGADSSSKMVPDHFGR